MLEEFLKHAAQRVDEMAITILDGQKLPISFSTFAHPICGMMFDIIFLGQEGPSSVLIESCQRDSKIQLIKELRTIFGGQATDLSLHSLSFLGLKEAKDMADGVLLGGSKLFLGVSAHLATKIKTRLESAVNSYGPCKVSVVGD
jgi:hypothetical protein